MCCEGVLGDERGLYQGSVQGCHACIGLLLVGCLYGYEIYWGRGALHMIRTGSSWRHVYSEDGFGADRR